MHGDGAVADEQRPGDLAAAVAPGQEGQHGRLALGEIGPATGRGGPGGQAGLTGQPGPAGQVRGQGEQRGRRELSGQVLARRQRAGGLLVAAGPDSGPGLAQGCSGDEAKPSWQTDTGCTRRTDNDVAAVADPNTGVAIYDTYDQGGWLEAGGTLAGPPAAGTYPASYLYDHTADLWDVTSGSDGSCSPAYLCTAGPGYDGPTGWGTPDGTAAFKWDRVTVTSPGAQSGFRELAEKLQITAASTGGYPVTYQATGLPAGLSINSSTGLISGVPSATGSWLTTVTATDSDGEPGSATFSWTIIREPGTCVARPGRDRPQICSLHGSAQPARPAG